MNFSETSWVCCCVWVSCLVLVLVGVFGLGFRLFVGLWVFGPGSVGLL